MNEGTPFRVVLADDEPLARDALREVIVDDEDLELVAEAAHGAEAIEAVLRLEPDILVLDIQMPEADGFEVVRRLGADRLPALVFVTAWDDYAVRAFEARALDYVLKPFPPRRLREAIRRAKDRVREGQLSTAARQILELARSSENRTDVEAPPRASGPGPSRQPRRERLTVTRGDRTVVVSVADIDWLEAADYYVRIHVGAQDHLIRRSLRWFEDELDPEIFVRVHRSAIVRIEKVAEIRRLGPDDYAALLRGVDRPIPLSRSGRERLLQCLKASSP